VNPPIQYTVRRSQRARRVRVNVTPQAQVEVVLPQRAPQRAAAAAVVELAPWIERRLAEARTALGRLPGRDGTLPYLDRRLALIAEPGRERVHHDRARDRLLVPEGDVHDAVERYYRRAARAEVARRLDRATAITGHPYSGLAIRSQRTRWASCSARGLMSFNWRLLLAPERILDYVVWHEVCHLQVANHSPRFWALVEAHWPTWRAERTWLTRNGAALVLSPALAGTPRR
jgi:hypothetical protein